MTAHCGVSSAVCLRVCGRADGSLVACRGRPPAPGVGVGLLLQLMRCRVDPWRQLSGPNQTPIFGLAQREEGQVAGPGEEEGEVPQ